MTRFRSPLRASHLRDILTQGEGITVRDIKPPQVQEPPRASPQLIGPENIRTESLGPGQISDRTRYAWLELGGATVRSGTGTLAMRGANTKYRAWNFRDAQSDEIAVSWWIPENLVGNGTGSPPSVVMRPMWVSLGAAAGNVVWKLTVNEVMQSPVDMNAAADTSYSWTENAQTQDKSTFAPITIAPWTVLLSNASQTDSLLNIRIMRDGNHASDTLTNDAGLLGVRIEYTADM